MSDVFPEVAINAFGANVPSHRSLVHTDLLPPATWQDPPIDDVCIHLGKYKRSIVLQSQISLLDS